MKKKKLKTKNLKQLIKDWDQKLKDSGFKDIEDRKTGLLKHHGGDISLSVMQNRVTGYTVGRGYSTIAWKDSQAEYYRIAGQLLHEAEFKSPRHRLIWQLHSEGVTECEIATILNITRRKVEYAIQKMQIEFGLKFVQVRHK